MNFVTLLLTLLFALVPSFVLAEYDSNAFTAPLAGDLVTAGIPFQIRWINLDGGIVNLVLVRGTPNSLKTVGALAAGIPNVGVFNWNVPSNLEAGTDYAIEIQSGAEKNFTPMFTVINPGPGAVSASGSTLVVKPPTILVEKTTDSGPVLTESYPIDPASVQAVQTLIVSSETTLIFPTPTEKSTKDPEDLLPPAPPTSKYSYTGGKIITLDPSPSPRYSQTTVTFEKVVPTTINGTSTAYTTNGTRTTSTWMTPTAGGFANHVVIGAPVSLAIILAGLMIVI
ncbi:hypothetical protein TWF281_001654 [Arthrobotrys megalospora]